MVILVINRALAGDVQGRVDEGLQLIVDAANSILLNDTDAEGAALTAIRVRDPASGTLNLNSDGTFVYTPNPNFSGLDTFVYRANDGSHSSEPATVTITVNPDNDPPVASNDSYLLGQSTTLSVSAAEADSSTGSVPTKVGTSSRCISPSFWR